MKDRLSSVYSIYENILIAALGSELFEQLIIFFKTIVESGHQIKITMSRKCFCLYKVFIPVLKHVYANESEPSHPVSFDNVFNDRSLFFNVGTVTDNSTVLIADDTILYGRTLAGIADDMQQVLAIDYPNMNLCVFAATDRDIVEKKEENFAFFTDDGALKYKKQNKTKRPFTPDDPAIKVYGEWFFCNNSAISQYNDRFIEAVHAVGESFSGYTPYFHIHFDELNGFFDAFSSQHAPMDFFASRLSGYQITDITIPQQKKYGACAFLVSDKRIECNGSLYTSFRVVVHEKLRRITVSPFVLLPNLQIGPAYQGFLEATGLRFTFDERVANIPDIAGKAKYNVIIYTLAYMASQHFIADLFNRAKSDITASENYANGHFINNDNQYALTASLNQLDLSKVCDFTTVFNDYIYEGCPPVDETDNTLSVIDCFNAAALRLPDILKDTTCDDPVFEFLSMFFNLLVRADRPLFAKNNRFFIKDMKGLVEGVFSKVSEKPVQFSNGVFYGALIKTLSQGIAGSRIQCDGINACMYIFEGENANSFVSLPIRGLLFSLRLLQQGLGDAYEQHKENIKTFLYSYIEKQPSLQHNERITLSRFNDLLNENPWEISDTTKYAFNETEDELKYFFNSFTRYYLRGKPSTLRQFRSQLTDVLRDIEKGKISVWEEEPVKLLLRYTDQ